MSRIEDIRARLDTASGFGWAGPDENIDTARDSFMDEEGWPEQLADLYAHAPNDLRDLLAVADAARLVSAALAEFGSYYVVDGRSVRHELDDALARLDAS